MNRIETDRKTYDHLVPDYCEALSRYGYEPTHDLGYFIRNGNSPEPVASIRIEGDGAFDALAEELVEDALGRISQTLDTSEENNRADRLKACHASLFEKHLQLWREMIAAACNSRAFTDTELRYYEKEIERAREELEAREAEASPSECAQARRAYDRMQMRRYHLLFDEALLADIERMVGNIVNERPTLLVGDKGIAKTEVAKFVMSLYGTTPKVVSVKGDMMSDELIGKMKHDRAQNTFVFQEGILLQAMRMGQPILLDEINFGDQAIIARLQEMLLRRAGESVFIQENGGETVDIAPGFIVFATANEASTRYRHREVLDPAIRDRFDIIVRNYPDLDADIFASEPVTLMRLAQSSAVDERGYLSKYIDEAFLESFVRLAYITEYLYATPAKDAVIEPTDDQVRSAVKEDSQPLLTDCITPRAVGNVVADCAAGNLPGRHLDIKLIDRLLHSLDQAGSRYNYELAKQVASMLGIDLDSGDTVQDGYAGTR